MDKKLENIIGLFYEKIEYHSNEAKSRQEEWICLKNKIKPIFEEVGVFFHEKEGARSELFKNMDSLPPINVKYSESWRAEECGLNFAILEIPEQIIMSCECGIGGNKQLILIKEKGANVCISQDIKGRVAIFISSPSVISSPFEKKKSDSEKSESDFHKYQEENILIFKLFDSPSEVKTKDIKDSINFMFLYALVTSYAYSLKFTDFLRFWELDIIFQYRLLWYYLKSWFYFNRDYMKIFSYVFRIARIIPSTK